VSHKNVLTETLFILTVEVVTGRAVDCHRHKESAKRLNLDWKTGFYVMTNRITLHSCTVCCIYYRCGKMFE